MAYPIRSGNWLSERGLFFDDNPFPGGFGRLEVLVASDTNCRVHREGNPSWVMVETKILHERWRPLRMRSDGFTLPDYIKQGTDLVWNRWSFSGRHNWVTRIPVKVARVRRSGWFTTIGTGEEDRSLWFWNAEHVAKHPDTFSLVDTSLRYHREAVI